MKHASVQQGTVDITAQDVWLQLEVIVHLQLCNPAGHLLRQTVELVLVTVTSESSDVPHVAHRTAAPASSSTVLILSLKIDMLLGDLPSGCMLNLWMELHPIQRILVICRTILLASMDFSSYWMLVALY